METERASGVGVWVDTPEGWIRGDQFVGLQCRQSAMTSYGKKIVSYYVVATVLSGADGPATRSLWRGEEADGVVLERAVSDLMHHLSSSSRGALVFEDGQIKLVPFTEARSRF